MEQLANLLGSIKDHFNDFIVRVSQAQCFSQGPHFYFRTLSTRVH